MQKYCSGELRSHSLQIQLRTSASLQENDAYCVQKVKNLNHLIESHIGSH